MSPTDELTDENRASERGTDEERGDAHEALWATAREAVRQAREQRRSASCSRPRRPREGWRG